MAEPTTGEFKAAMRGFVGACSLITMGAGEAASGLVVTSGISLTAAPPMVLACINRASSGWPLLKRLGGFGWSALGAGHQAVAERFSGVSGIRGPAPEECENGGNRQSVPHQVEGEHRRCAQLAPHVLVGEGP